LWAGIGWLAGGMAVPYLAATLAASLQVAHRERRRVLAVLMPLAFSSLHLAYGVGSLWGCARAGFIVASLRMKLKSMPEPTS
jgi:hypothetical protein